jgi:carboxyl-terminal processing protease
MHNFVKLYGNYFVNTLIIGAISIMYSKSFMATIIMLMLIGTVAHSNDKVQQQLEKLNKVIKTAQDNHLNRNETSILVDAAIRGILKELDPHSYYFTPKEMKEIEARRTGNFFGVGITFTIIKDTINILNVMRQGPAFSAGIDVGDKILKIDGESAIGITMEDVDNKLRGERNTYVTLELLKTNGKVQKDLNIVRSRIPVYSINSSYLIDDTQIGYIKISRFNATTHIELTDSLSILSQMGMTGLIIDLRGNPGGIVEQVYLVADEFIDENENVLITKGRDPETASAPEILAGAFQDLDRGLVLGQTSFGKGLVQKPYRLADGSEFWLTVAKYYTPSGRSIQKDYSNKETYGTLKDRIVLKDGMNLGHTSELTAEHGFT